MALLLLVSTTEPEAPVPTVARITVSDVTVILEAETPPNVMLVTFNRPVPRMSTFVPVVPVAGEKEVKVNGGGGGAVKTNPGKEAAPPGAVTATLPVAPEPTVAEI